MYSCIHGTFLRHGSHPCCIQYERTQAGHSRELLEKLWAYIVGIGHNIGVRLLATGGTRDHVHVLFALPADMPAARAVQRIKANSSRWMGQHGIAFAWQEGYAAFSVSASEYEAVKRYIANQAEHHRKRTFEEELLTMLKRAGVAYDAEKVFG